MATNIEKRLSARYYEDSQIMYSHFLDHPYCYYGAQMRNYSENGIYFESQYSIKPGTLIYVRKTYSSAGVPCNKFEKPNQMYVVWSQKTHNIDDSLYRVGTARFDQSADKTNYDPFRFPKAQITKRENAILNSGISAGIVVKEETEVDLREAKKIAESRAKKLQILNHFALSIASTLDLQEILQIICKEMVSIFGARNTGIGLLNRKKTNLRLVAFYTDSKHESDATGLELPLERNASTQYVVNTGQAIVVPDAQNNPINESVHEISRKRGTQCVMIVPLMTRGEVLGTIGLPTSDTNRIFTTEEVSLAQTIASQVAGAIDNARLFAKTEKAKKLAEQDLEIGHKIQTNFFPEKIPILTGWEVSAHFEAARQVTGDFYDIISIENNQKVAIVIADVCDHGVGSALFMVLFRSLIRAFIQQNFSMRVSEQDYQHHRLDTSLLNTISLTNNYIANTHERSGMFASVFLGVLSPDTGLLKYINCGHEAPFIIARSGIKTRLKPTGPVVGVFPDMNYFVNQIHINPEETFFAFTDGATDAQNPEGELFTKDRLSKLLAQPAPSTSDLLNKIINAIRKHVSDMDQYDDITLLAVRRK